MCVKHASCTLCAAAGAGRHPSPDSPGNHSVPSSGGRSRSLCLPPPSTSIQQHTHVSSKRHLCPCQVLCTLPDKPHTKSPSPRLPAPTAHLSDPPQHVNHVPGLSADTRSGTTSHCYPHRQDSVSGLLLCPVSSPLTHRPAGGAHPLVLRSQESRALPLQVRQEIPPLDV